MSAGVVIFVLTYALVSMRRLSWLGFDRPAGALLGAVACVVVGVLTPAQALAAIDGPTILLLFGVMGMGAYLAVDGFFDQLEDRLVRAAKTPRGLLGAVVWSSGLLSAFITNDAVCVLGAPVLVRVIQRHELPPTPYLLALCTAANTGSVATVVGNPQNMLCAELGDLSYLQHLLWLGPVAVIGLVINHVLLLVLFRRRLAEARLREPPPRSPWRGSTALTISTIVGTAIAYAVGADLAWASVTGFVAAMLLHRRDTGQIWPRIDWSLLLFFAGLFVVVGGLERTGAPARLFERFPLDDGGETTGWIRLAAIFFVGSNVVSNVPFILLVRDGMSGLSDPRLAWELLAMASTFAGNLTLLGSVANVIVAENARSIGGLGFFEHLRVGAPIAIATTVVGVGWLLWIAS